MKSVTYTIARPDSGAVLPYAVVTVFNADGATLAALFNAGGVAIGNPVTADSNGAVSFAAANGTYLLSARSADGAQTLPNISVQVFDLDALATAIAAGSLSGVIGAKFETEALRDADLAHAAGTIALVYGDSDPLKNDLSYKIGASGSGSWSAPLGLMAGLAYNYAQLAVAQGDRVEAFLDNLNEAQTVGRAVDPVTGTSTSGTFTYFEPVIIDGYIAAIRAFSLGSGTIKVRRMLLSGTSPTQIGVDTNVPVIAGLHVYPVNIPINAGERLGVFVPSGTIPFTIETADGTGFFFDAGDSTSYDDTFGPRTASRLQIGFDIVQPYVTKERLQDIEDDVLTAQGDATSALAGIGDIGEETSVIVEDYAGTTVFAGTSFGGWAGVVELDNAAVGTTIKRIGFDGVLVGSGATKINLKVYTRANSETAAPPTNCTLVFSQDYTLAELGLTAGDTNRKTITMEFPDDFVKASGTGLAYRWEAQDGSSAKISSSTGYLPDSGASASERGWYYGTTASGSYTAISSPNRLALRVARDGFEPAKKSDVVATADASIAVSGTTVTVTGTVRRNGTDYPFSDSLTLSYAASGEERMDKIVVDRSSLAVSAVSGSSRDTQLDSLEWQGATPSNAIVIGRARVTSSAISAVSTAQWNGLVKSGTEAEVNTLIERNRRILRKVIAKATRGGTIKLGGYGDSITALQSSTPTFNANGTMRDRGLTYLANYPSDTQALLTLYDTGDGAGTVHTRLGWNWKIKAALEDLGGTVTYNNYGIGGTTSQDTTNNGLDPARIAVPLADGLDVVVIAFGMNERGQSYTYANILDMIGQFQAVGTACIVMGCPRPNGNQSTGAWRMTNDQLEAAAMDGAAAYVSTVMIAEDRNLGGIGVPAEALASANTSMGGNNHPGIWELNQYGEAAVMLLGLS